MPSPLQLVRRSLWPLSFVWAAVSSVRNRAFDAGWKKVERVGLPVISVGNLSVGGTGKTPMVAWLVERLQEAGRRPAVVARGYGRADGERLNDEGMLLAERFDQLVQEQDPDRVAAAKRVVDGGAADVIVLDDGFQHRRMHRDLDIVLLDARRPLAGGVCLPAGDLRESPVGLRRASMLVLTRAERLSEEGFSSLVGRLRSLARNPALPVFRAAHAPESVRWPVDPIQGAAGRQATDRAAGAPEELSGRQVALLSGIARPESFEDTVEGLGAEVVWHERKGDHHLHQDTEVRRFLDRANELGALPLTTEKDAVKLGDRASQFAILRIGIEFLGSEPTLEQLGLGGTPGTDRTRAPAPGRGTDRSAADGSRGVRPGGDEDEDDDVAAELADR